MRSFLCSAAIVLLVTAAVVGCSQTSEPIVTPTAGDSVEATNVVFANAKCPIMGGKPKAELTANYKGETIGFCCDGCPEKWSARPAEQQAIAFAKVDSEAVHSDVDRSDAGHSDTDHVHSSHSGE